MADVFLSYKRDERTAVEQIASRLRALGLTVWFDASVSAGETFNAEIDREARAAKAILVCWSPSARQSEWVNAEAMIGFTQKKLAACYVAGPDGFDPPTPFNTRHAEDLRAWLSEISETDAAWRSVLRRIGKLCGRTDIETWAALDAQTDAAELRVWIAAHKASPLLRKVNALLRMREDEVAQPAQLQQKALQHRASEVGKRSTTEDHHSEADQARPYVDQEQALSAKDLGAVVTWMAWIVGLPLLLIGLFALGSVFRGIGVNSAGTPVTTVSEATHISAPSPSQPLRIGQEFDDCAGAGWCPRMIVIPSGGIMMGDDTNAETQPRHLATVERFAVGKFELTFAEWDACVNGGGCRQFSPADEGWGRGRRPVINVSWDDAQQYVQWLSGATGRHYRLLTEAEWEFSARAFTQTAYYTGANFTSADGNVHSAAMRTRPVGTYAPNPFGLHDLNGNVSEWVQDCWHDNYDGAPTDGSAWTGGDCTYRTVRGDSWLGFSEVPASSLAERTRSIHTAATTTLGFRVARTL